MPENWMPVDLGTLETLSRGIISAVLIFAVGWIGSKWARRLTLKAFRLRPMDAVLARFLSNLAQYTVLVATVIAALGAVGVETTSLIAVLASAGLAIGLALQGSLSHFASGVMILFFRPFTLGDVVEVSGQVGTVDDVGLFATTLVTFDNRKVIIPNGKVMGDSIVNLTTLGTRRAGIDVGVAYGSDVGRVAEILLEAAKSVEVVLEDPAPVVLFQGFGDSALDFTLNVWARNDDYLQLLVETRRAVYERLNAAGIEIPFPQVVMHKAG